MILRTNVACDDCGKRHTPGNPSECVEGLLADLAAERAELTAERTAHAETKRLLEEERARWDWVFSLDGASRQQIEDVLMNTDTPDEARVAIDAARKAKG